MVFRVSGAEIHSVYEAGFAGLSLHRQLAQRGIQNIVVNPASIERASNDRVKTDKIDAKKLAIQLSLGNLKPNHIPTVEEELDRQFHRTRHQLVTDRVKVGNRIKSKLTYFGFESEILDTKMSGLYLKKLEVIDLPTQLKIVIDILIDEWRQLQTKINHLESHMKNKNKTKSRQSDIISSVPGIGNISTNIILTELGDMKRFKNERSLSCFIGLTPSEFSSGDYIRKGHITRQGAPRLRRMLVEIAWRAIAKDPSLKKTYNRIGLRRGGKIAIVAIARKVIGRVRSCLQHDCYYKIASSS